MDSPLHQCETKELQDRITECAQNLSDTNILSQIVTYGDLIAQEGKYHLKCLVSLYNRDRKAKCRTQADVDQMLCESMAFADIVSYVRMQLLEDDLVVNHGKSVFACPPTSAALRQHALRAAYQAGILWGVATQVH